MKAGTQENELTKTNPRMSLEKPPRSVPFRSRLTPKTENPRLTPPKGEKAGKIQENGGDLLSHCDAVPSARGGLTSLFGMGRGGTLAL